MMPFFPPFGFNRFKRPMPYGPYYNSYYNNLHKDNLDEKKNSKIPYFPNQFGNYNEKNFNKNNNFNCTNQQFNNLNFKSQNFNGPNFNTQIPNNLNFSNNKENEQENFFCSNNIDFNDTDEYKEDFFDFFGLKLASDDVLILALLFFFYKEDVKDTYLYIALLLLLLS